MLMLSAHCRVALALLLTVACAPPIEGDEDTPTAPPVPAEQTLPPEVGPEETPPVNGTPAYEGAVVGTPAPQVLAAIDGLSPPLEGTLYLSMDSYLDGGAAVTRGEDGAIGWSETLDDALTGFCGFGGCAHHEVLHTLQGSTDLLTMVGTRGLDQSSAVYRVGMADLRSRFTLTGFDFSGVPSAGCTQPPELTCAASVTTGPLALCRVGFAHTFEFTVDEPNNSYVAMIIGDHFGQRLVGVSLDYSLGGSCGRVDWVLNSSDPVWVPGCEPNSMQLFKDSGVDHLLVTCRNTSAALGAGRLVLYKMSGAVGQRPSFERLWVYPATDDLSDPEGALASPHDGRLNRTPGGGYTLSYAHTGGLGDSLDLVTQSTVGVATLSSLTQPPVYAADLYLTQAQGQVPLRIVTTVDWHEPGWFMVGDTAGYVNKPGESGTRRLLFAIHAPSPTTKHGGWSQDHSDQNLVAINDDLLLDQPCMNAEAYQLTLLTPSEFGDTLTEVAGAPASCQRQP